jgi:anthranilate synthase component 2
MLLLIDNYDSFTWNLAHRMGELGADVRVVRNDAIDVDAIAELRPSAIVISPGPGRPEGAGISMAVLKRFGGTLPMLGVCLGHQAIGAAFGGRITRAPVPVHGKISLIAHDGSGLFAGLGDTVEVGRYHSLVIDRDAVPADFVVSAWTVDDRIIMGVRHTRWPLFGVQFHPESVLTPTGHRLLKNFLEVR